MKALVYGGPGDPSWTQVPDPGIRHPLDVIIRVDAAAICTTDLRILRGEVPTVRPGRVLGHEAVGTVEQTGGAICGLLPGDRVLVSSVSACTTCRPCRDNRSSRCTTGGRLLGTLINGVHAEYARVPYAERSTYKLPPTVSDAAALLLAEVLPTAYELGVGNGRMRAGDTVVVVGAGPVGLAVAHTASLCSPAHVIAIDPLAGRLEAAKLFGADLTATPREDLLGLVHSVTGGLGADVVVEAVGDPRTFELCTALVRPGGRVAGIGRHSRPATLHLEDLWSRGITITTGLVDAHSTVRLLDLVASGRLDAGHLITDWFAFADIVAAYDVAARPAQTGALKVALARADLSSVRS